MPQKLDVYHSNENLKAAGVEVNRKALADLAVREPTAFAELARIAKEHDH